MAKQRTAKKSPEKKVNPGSTSPQETSSNDQKLQDRVTVASAKVAETLKTGAQKVAHFTGSATKLSKLRVEIHSLQSEVEKEQLEAGKQLWEMHKANNLPTLNVSISAHFKKIERLKKEIAAKEKDAESISLVE